jgi:hypothetical protein
MDGAAAGLRQTTVSHMQTVIRPISRESALDLVQRSKTPPKGAAIFVATCLTREPALINDYHAAAVTADLLGTESSSALVKMVKDLPPTGDGRAQVITLSVVLGALESRLCGLSRCVRCSLAFPRLVWRVLGTSCLWHLPANGGRCV